MLGLQMIHEMDNLQHEMEQFFRGLGCRPLSNEIWQNSAIKLTDGGEVYEVEAMLPGIDTDKLEISILGKRLTLKGEVVSAVAPEGSNWHRRERLSGGFEKTLLLPTKIDNEKVEAEYKLGVLRITLPKAASDLPKKISIKSA